MLALETRLIVVEGLPAAGKTTASTSIAESTVRRLVLDQCDGRWDACYAQIDAFLG